ncbi:MAG: patatin-like phospholipase family protein [Gammaproteobacteria bacterium]|nr:patatin-like phospholipase family protein [Gammaproteobacteria bacterium]
MASSKTTTRIGLVLGGGAARGWAHIGVIRKLIGHGIPIHAVCGSSIGALVGGAFAAGRLEALAKWVQALDRVDVVRLLDPALVGGGFIQGTRLMEVMAEFVPDVAIEDLDVPFACTATDLRSGREIWIREGSLPEAVRASIALPGLFTPVQREGRWVADGGLCNPVPVSLARTFDVDWVAAVNLNSGIVGRHLGRPEEAGLKSEALQDGLQRITANLPADWAARVRNLLAWGTDHDRVPGLLDVTATAINIMQDQITRSRLAGDPPDVIIAPRLKDIALMDFHRATAAIAAGEQAAENAIPTISALLEGL